MSQSSKKHKPARFGTLLGVAPGNVPVYSSDYATATDIDLPDRHAYRSYVDGIYVGHKWQCVEFARRWMYINKGLIFDDVGMAYEIFDLTTVRDVRNNQQLPMRSFANGSRRPPEPGCLLVWAEGGEFGRTGHVAVVVEVQSNWVRFAEQNFDHCIWPNGRNYSREIKAKRSPTGEYWIESSFADATILGWVIQTDDPTDAVPIEERNPELFTMISREAEATGADDRAWLNLANADEAAFVEFMHGHHLSEDPDRQRRYFMISESAEEELERATNQLHTLFMHATDYVLRDDALLTRFGIPPSLWPKIHQSWDNRHNQMITGRFDFAMTDRGLKLYEYNCDSAACYLECGKIQGKWAVHNGCDVGRDAGGLLHDRLRDAWRASGIEGIVHILHDDDPEEIYHALFMQEAMERAGLESRLICGTAGLSWSDEGGILDEGGAQIRWVWKSWAWETALDQIRLECEDDEEKLRSYRPGEPHTGAVRLVDVLLRSEVMVYEPLWTLVTSNKAILPILWSLFPNHPFLLHTEYEPTEELRVKGFVTKPIVGRCGSNITIRDPSAGIVEETAGRFEHRDQIHQEFFRLAKIDGLYVQPSTFSVSGAYAASTVRVDTSLVITSASDNLAMRIVDDDQFLAIRHGLDAVS